MKQDFFRYSSYSSLFREFNAGSLDANANFDRSFIVIRFIYPMSRRRRTRHTKFRPSSSRLLEWAQQAGFTDVDSDAESNESGIDEEIPLTLRMYGSAPSTGVVYGSTSK